MVRGQIKVSDVKIKVDRSYYFKLLKKILVSRVSTNRQSNLITKVSTKFYYLMRHIPSKTRLENKEEALFELRTTS